MVKPGIIIVVEHSDLQEFKQHILDGANIFTKMAKFFQIFQMRNLTKKII